MKAQKVRPETSSRNLRSVGEIAEIYIDEWDCFVCKETLHEFLRENPGSIQVDILPFPNLIPGISASGARYVRSKPDRHPQDNLVDLKKN